VTGCERTVGEAEHLWDFATEREIPLRTAAYASALTRIGEAADAKGSKELYQQMSAISAFSALSHHDGTSLLAAAQ
jgi:hypothetical protein